MDFIFFTNLIWLCINQPQIGLIYSSYIDLPSIVQSHNVPGKYVNKHSYWSGGCSSGSSSGGWKFWTPIFNTFFSIGFRVREREGGNNIYYTGPQSFNMMISYLLT